MNPCAIIATHASDPGGLSATWGVGNEDSNDYSNTCRGRGEVRPRAPGVIEGSPKMYMPDSRSANNA